VIVDDGRLNLGSWTELALASRAHT